MRRLTRPGPAARPSPEPLRAPGRPGNLPAELNRFIGRDDELAALARELESARLVTLTGVGGGGKTRLAGHLAAILQDRFCDGVWLVELASLREAHLMDHAVAEVLAPAGLGGRPVRAALCEQLADRELLLVLDGYEHLVDACAGLTAELLRRAPGLRVLAAGRRPLGLSGERIVPLAPMNTADATALFADRAASVVAGYTVGPSDEAAVGELCDRLDGIPLALELAAGRLRALSVHQVLHRLDDRFRLLTGTRPRHSPGSRLLPHSRLRSSGRSPLRRGDPRPATRPCAPRSAGAMSCAPPRNGCCGRGCRSSPGSSIWRRPSTSARARSCRPMNSWTSSRSWSPSRYWCARRPRPGCATGCWTPYGSTARAG